MEAVKIQYRSRHNSEVVVDITAMSETTIHGKNADGSELLMGPAFFFTNYEIALPEHEKLKAAKDSGELHHIGNFLTWLLEDLKAPSYDRKGRVEEGQVYLAVDSYVYEDADPLLLLSQILRRDWPEADDADDMGRWAPGVKQLRMGEVDRGDLIGMYLGVDPKILEEEKRAMLAEIRVRQAA